MHLELLFDINYIPQQICALFWPSSLEFRNNAEKVFHFLCLLLQIFVSEQFLVELKIQVALFFQANHLMEPAGLKHSALLHFSCQLQLPDNNNYEVNKFIDKIVLSVEY